MINFLTYSTAPLKKVLPTTSTLGSTTFRPAFGSITHIKGYGNYYLQNRENGIAILGSSGRTMTLYEYEQTKTLLEKLATKTINNKPVFFVTGGGLGVMEEAAKAGNAIGIAYAPLDRGPSTKAHTALYKADELGERTDRLWQYSARALVFPGGIGTLAEVLDKLVRLNVGGNNQPAQKRIVFFDYTGIYKKLFLPFITQWLKARDYSQHDPNWDNRILGMLKIVDTPDEAIEALLDPSAPWTSN